MSDRLEHRLEHEELQLLRKILRLLETPRLTLTQLGDAMSIGNITAGQTGQFGIAINFPSGVTPPAGYNPTINWSSSDSNITFQPATTDLSNGAIPLSQQVVASVPASDTNTTASIGGSCLGTDGVTVLTSNPVSFSITPAPPPTEPTLVASQLG